MSLNYTTLLGLVEPVTGTESGTWGDDVNKGLTDYLDAAIAGTQTISGNQTAVTLSVTNGSSSANNITQVSTGSTGTAQFAVINCTGNPASTLTITVPASSRQYVVLNATSTNQSVKIVGAGPTTGVTLVAGEKAHIAWNGSDFVKIATTTLNAAGSNKQVQYNSSGVLAGSNNLTFDGTNLGVAINAAPSGTYTLEVGTTSTGTGSIFRSASSQVQIYATDGTVSQSVGYAYGSLAYSGTISNHPYAFLVNNSEVARFTTAGYLGVGVASPLQKLDVNGTMRSTSASATGGVQVFNNQSDNTTVNAPIGSLDFIASSGAQKQASIKGYVTGSFSDQVGLGFYTNNATSYGLSALLDSRGNLGLGVIPTASWRSGANALQSGAFLSAWTQNNGTVNLSFAAYEGSADVFKYLTTGNAPTLYSQVNGVHTWYNAPAGTAGNTITFTNAMTLDSNSTLAVTGGASFGNSVAVANSVSTGDANIELGNGRTGNGNAFIDFHASAGTDYDFRVIRTPGVNGDAVLNNQGTGSLVFSLNNSEAGRFTSAGSFLVGTTTATARVNIQVTSGSSNALYLYSDTNTTVDVLANPNSGSSWTVAPPARISFSGSGSFTSGTDIQFWTKNAGTSSSSEALRFTVSAKGNMYGTSGFTSMTDGFFYIPAANGAPSGTPSAYTGTVPMYYDKTNNKFYVYNGAWKGVALT